MNSLSYKEEARTSTLPLVSIVILNHNGKRFLEDCLSSVFNINYPHERFEVILVDNASTDDSVGFVEEKYPLVKVLALDANYGFASGNNKGIKLAKGEIFAFLNNDTVVDGNWLNRLVQPIENAKADICGSKIVFMKNPDAVQYSGGYLHLIGGAIFVPFHRVVLGQSYYLVGSVSGASFAIRRDVFEDLEGFDDDFFMYAEEGDLCLRALVSGYKIAYSPFSITYHYGGGSGSLQPPHKHKLDDVAYSRLVSPLTTYYGNRNSIVMSLKTFQTKNVLKALTFSYLYLFVQLILLLFRRPSEAKLLVMAAFWPLFNLKKIWQKRLMVQVKRKVTDDWLIRRGLLLSIGQTLKLRSLLKKNVTY